MDRSDTTKAEKRKEKTERLAEALRANLVRRKAKRRTTETPTPADGQSDRDGDSER